MTYIHDDRDADESAGEVDNEWNSRKLEGTQGFFKGSTRKSNRRKKTQEKGQRGKISQITGGSQMYIG